MGQTRLSTVSRGCSPTPAWMPSREPSTTCPSPLHFTGSPICRLGRGRKTNLLPDPGYVALTNICQEDGGCQDLPGHSSKNPVKNMSPKSPAAMFSCLDINTKKTTYSALFE